MYTSRKAIIFVSFLYRLTGSLWIPERLEWDTFLLSMQITSAINHPEKYRNVVKQLLIHSWIDNTLHKYHGLEVTMVFGGNLCFQGAKKNKVIVHWRIEIFMKCYYFLFQSIAISDTITSNIKSLWKLRVVLSLQLSLLFSIRLSWGEQLLCTDTVSTSNFQY